MQLMFVVTNSDDPRVAQYVMQNLYSDSRVSARCFKMALRSVHDTATTHLVQLYWNPSYRQKLQKTQKTAPGLSYFKMVRDQADLVMKQQQDTQLLLSELMMQDDATLRAKIMDDNPLVRMLAVQVVGKKRLPVEKELISLLADPHPQIRQVARQSLVRMARGTDFGPEPTANMPQIAMSMQHWNAWLALQQDVPAEKAYTYESGKK